jgi:hypothetical protein
VVRALKALAVVAVVLFLAARVADRLIGETEPEWYAPPTVDQDVRYREAERLAERAEYRVIEEAQRRRGADAPWTLRLREEHVNAWLATRLREWIGSRPGLEWPAALGTPQVKLEAGRVALALPAVVGGVRRVVVARVQPAIDQRGLTLRLESLRLGRLSVPGDPLEHLAGLLEQVDSASRAELAELVDVLAGRTPLRPLIQLSDGRHVEIMAIDCQEGSIDLTSRTAPEHDRR